MSILLASYVSQGQKIDDAAEELCRYAEQIAGGPEATVDISHVLLAAVQNTFARPPFRDLPVIRDFMSDQETVTAIEHFLRVTIRRSWSDTAPRPVPMKPMSNGIDTATPELKS